MPVLAPPSPLWITVDATGHLRGYRRRRPHRLDTAPVTQLPAGAACVLMAPAAQMLERRVTLPVTTDLPWRTVLAFEMDRLTPFRAGDVAWDYTPCRENRQAVILRLVPHSCVTALAAQARQVGLQPVAVGVVTPERLQLLPLTGPPEPQPRHHHTRRILTGLVALLTGLALVLPLVVLPSSEDAAPLPPQRPQLQAPAAVLPDSLAGSPITTTDTPIDPPSSGPVQGRLIGVVITPEMAEVLVQSPHDNTPQVLRRGDVWQGRVVSAITTTQVTFAADGGTLILDGTE